MKRAMCAKLCALLLFLSACGTQTENNSATIFAMDTQMELTAYGSGADEAVRAATQEINRLDALLSAQREGSFIYQLNHAQGEPVSRDTDVGETLLLPVIQLCEDTGGALDITVYPAVEAWGFPSGSYRVPEAAELDALREKVDYREVSVDVAEGSSTTVTLPQNMSIDLGAVGKGYAADRVVELWKDMGVTSGLLNLGGNVQCLGGKPDGSDWTVAIRHPEDQGRYLATVTGRDMAVVTSGAYQRNFELDGVIYHHILDPATCMPADSGLTSVTIVAESGLLADGLSTAVYVMGPDRAGELWRERRDFDMVLYTEDGTLWYTPGLAGRFAPAEGLTAQVLE